MTKDVIIGHDGKPRCAWAGAGDTALLRYHDEVWGTRTYDDAALFEALTLGVFQAGLSWWVVFGKRDGFRNAFHGFDVAAVAAMTEPDVGRLLQDPSIIRNRAKIQATVENASAMRSAQPSLAALAQSYASTRKRAPRSLADLPTSTAQAEKFAKQLKSQGYHFVGPTSVYAFMQNIGVVNDHIHRCFRATDYTQPQPTRKDAAMDFWTTEQRGHVAVATFSNPPFNFVTREVFDELGKVVAGCEDPATRAVVVRSDPQSPAGFSSYSVEELFGFASDPERSRYSGELGRSLKANLDRLTALPKVTIAALNGNALGGSFELTLACDLRIGQHGDFRYGNPEVRAGVIPGGGGTQRVTRLVGLARALDWVLRGRIVTPEVAFELGLVHEVVDDAVTRALELANEIALLPPMAVANAKRALYQGADTHLQAAFEIEDMNWTEVMQSDDAQLAMTTILGLNPENARDWFESESSKSYPAYSGH